jgi:hypothetical protein
MRSLSLSLSFSFSFSLDACARGQKSGRNKKCAASLGEEKKKKSSSV